MGRIPAGQPRDRSNPLPFKTMNMSSFYNIRTILFLLPLLILLNDSCNNKSGIIITTSDVSEITQTTAVSGGFIKAAKWGPVTARGVCWATTTDPTLADDKTSDGDQTGSFVSKLTGLQPGTDYYLRAYVTSSTDTVYGRNISFLTQAYSTVTDVEGNVYNVVTIGNQAWMAENLRTTMYSDSTSIPLVKDEIKWAILSTPAYCWYKNDEEAFKPTYGALYNWYSVNTGKLCPDGWHVPIR